VPAILSVSRAAYGCVAFRSSACVLKSRAQDDPSQSVSQLIKQQTTKGHLHVASIYNSYSAQSTGNVFSMYEVCSMYEIQGRIQEFALGEGRSPPLPTSHLLVSL